MGSRTGSWILLGLVAGVASLASAANLQHSDGQSLYQNNGNTFLSNGAGQIFRRPDGRTVLIGSDGRQIVTDSSGEDDSLDFDSSRGGQYSSNNNNIIINGGQSTMIQRDGKMISYSVATPGSYINQNGRSLRVLDGGIEVNENGQVHTFRSKARTENQKETVTFNGQPAQVEYSNGDIIVEFADHTVIAKVGNRTFMGDRNSFDNRDKVEAESVNQARLVHESIQKSMAELNANLQNTFRNIFV